MPCINISIMKKITLLFLIITFQQVNAQEILINQSIIDLMEFGFETDVIISKIKTTDCAFNTEMNDLIKLKEKNVPSNVISAMIEFGKPKKEFGIFYKTIEQLKKIEANSFTSNSTDATAMAFTMGLASSKTKAKLDGATSRNILSNSEQEFIFQFDKNNDKIGQVNWWFHMANSPESFALVKMKIPSINNSRSSHPKNRNSKVKKIIKKANSRELVIGKIGFGTYKIGINEKEMIPFVFENIGANRFRVVPKNSLDTGEYCFVLKGTYAGYINQSVFDFSISDQI